MCSDLSMVVVNTRLTNWRKPISASRIICGSARGGSVQVRTILLVEQQTLLRQGMRKLLEDRDDLQMIGEAEEAEEAVVITAQLHPDIVLLDIQTIGSGLVGTMKRISENSPDSRVIVLGMHDDLDLLRTFTDSGISGYMLKTVPWEELVAAINTVCEDPSRFVFGLSRYSLIRKRTVQLTERERQVLELTAQAFTNRQIASQLSLTEATVKRHLRGIFRKLGASSRLDAVNRAARMGLTELSIE
jgi:DNA-binding NarL/FixJ family response regulator